MDHLKAVGKAIKNSPKAIRKKFTGGTGASDGHEILEEDWYHSADPVKAGVSFFVKYLGSTRVTQTHGPGSTDDAVKKIVNDAKLRGHKLQKVEVTVSTKFIKLMDVNLKSKLDEIPLYRVSYCTVDPYYDKVFCYICRNGETKKLECHAFLCSKRSKAEAITLTVAQAFNIAYEKWVKSKKEKKEAAANGTTAKPTTDQVADSSTASADIGEPITAAVSIQPQPPVAAATKDMSEMKIEVTPSSPTRLMLEAESPSGSPHMERRSPSPNALAVQCTIPKAKSLDYIAVDDEFEMEFQKLAEARSNPHLLDIGDIDRSEIGGDVHQYLKGEKTSEELVLSKSHDDLLQL